MKSGTVNASFGLLLMVSSILLSSISGFDVILTVIDQFRLLVCASFLRCSIAVGGWLSLGLLGILPELFSLLPSFFLFGPLQA
jgi:hypothetical protein